MYSKLFERILLLNDESYHKIIKDPEAFEKLQNIKLNKSELEFLGLSPGISALKTIEKFKKYYELSYLFLDNNDEVVGICAATTGDLSEFSYWAMKKHNINLKIKENHPIIENYSLIGIKENSVTLVRDMIDLIKQHINKYEIVSWTVDLENKHARRIYDRFLPRLGGISVINRVDIRYIVKKGTNLQDYRL
jgi:hypothetical protein